MSEFSPFASKRYEYSGNHVYYIPPDVFRQLEQPIPTYLIGTRGTGKTTLLKALSWNERLYNRSLQAQLKRRPFDGQNLGVYFKLPNVQLSLIERWLSDEPDDLYGTIVSFYLDLCWLEAIQPAIKQLEAAGTLRILQERISDLADHFRQLWRAHPECKHLFGEPGNTVDSVFSLMHPMRRGIERFARTATQPDLAADALPMGQIGSFGRTVGRLLVDSLTGPSDGQWSIRVCMDEGEVLTLRQQRAVNSMVRLTEWPVFYLVSYVSRPHDVTGTFLPNQTLQHADRQILVRDDMTDAAFRKLAEGVVNVRLKAHVGAKVRLSTKKVLGTLSIDNLLLRILRDSESRPGRELLEAALNTPGYSASDGGPPPIYETYLRRVRPELARSVGESAFERRKQSSASIRKQMVAAYLSICDEVHARPMYASAEMLEQISDKCIRDFLWQMESIFARYGGQIETFLNDRPISVAMQNAGLRDAAELKMALFLERVISAPAEANRFVEGLGMVTARIQSRGRNYEHIRTPERGVFSYRRDAAFSESVGTQNLALIRDAAEAGFLRIVDDSEPDEIRFRVHASLAPHFNFSYRGAYYSAGTLSDEDIYRLRTASTGPAMETAVGRICERLTGRRPRKEPVSQLRLSEGTDQ